MKRVVCFFLCAAFLCCAISGCGDKPEAELPIEPEVSEEPTAETEPLRIVTTIFPIYDWVRQILGERSGDAEITLLLDSGVDLHSYLPAVDDMVKISECDLFVYVGGESDQWAEDVLRKTANDHSVNLLDALNEAYLAAVETGRVKTVLFGDRFPFRYLTEDYGLDYYAAFSGCSAETEASFETVAFLANKVDELGLKAVLTIESSDGRLAQTIIDNTKTQDASILRMDSLQSTTARDVEAGATYLAAMERNLAVLKEALC